MKSLHTNLMQHSSLYKEWHKNQSLASMMHWLVFVFVALVLTHASLVRIDNGAANLVANTIAASAPATPSSQLIPGSYIVTFTDDVSDIPGQAKQLATQYGGNLKFAYTAALKGAALEHLPSQAVEGLKHNPHVKIVEQDQAVSLESTEDLGSNSGLWGLDRIDQRLLPRNNIYTYQSTGAGVTAYIVDSGVRATHTEFGGRVKSGYSTINDGNGTSDCAGHGTHVAGIVGGQTVGVAKGVSVVPVRVFDCNGNSTMSGVIAAMDWIAKNRTLPAVANMSLAGAVSSTLNSAVQSTINAGVTVVVAAGNYSLDACSYSPANMPAAITVGASNTVFGAAGIVDARDSYSDYGTCVDVFAPGSSILSAWYTSDTATMLMSGTSMATPFASGVVALYLSTHPQATPAEVSQAIVSSATPGVLTNLGSGSPNLLLYSLFDSSVTSTPPPPATDTTSPSAPTLSASATDSTHITLSWTAATDNVGVTGYKVFRNGSQLTSVTSISYTDSSVQAGTNYTFAVSAYDLAGNTSPQSNTVNVTTPAIQPPPPPPPTSFSIGDAVYATAKVNVRSTPTTKGKPLGTQKTGSTGVIVAGPQTSSGYTWWQIDFTSGVDGWVVQDYLSK